ncbi:SDR family NAD(P)-dependent oxidoreductase [Streptomyces sp. NPDC004752]
MSVLVTGAGDGIGRAVAEALLEEGHHVVAVDLDTSRFAAEVVSDRLHLLDGDVQDADLLDRAGRAACQHGRLEGVVACAGISRPGDSGTYPAELWHEVLGVDLDAVFETLRLAARYAEGEASLVAISSIAGHQGFAGRAAYSAAKAGVEGLVRSLAVEWAPSLRVNAIAPGYVRTAMVDRNIADGVVDEATLVSRTPMGRLGTPADVAAAVSFLLSDRAAWITGTTLVVDGGWTVYGLNART